jgi:hypothetical protein
VLVIPGIWPLSIKLLAPLLACIDLGPAHPFAQRLSRADALLHGHRDDQGVSRGIVQRQLATIRSA